MRNAITDVPGVLVGHVTRIGGGFLTGTTVVLLPPGNLVVADVRGGGPATVDTAAVDARYGGREVPGVVLTGGSAYGLAAARGAAAELGGGVVPGAALFDLGRGGDFGARPDASFGALAVRAASVDVPQGNVGAGAGALNVALKGGVGTASADLGGGVVVGAIAALNAVGPSYSPDGLPLAAGLGLPGEFPSAVLDPAVELTPPAPPPFNTVIGVVATNAAVPPFALAVAGQDGVALAVSPAHGMADGDTVFGAVTGDRQAPPDEVLRAASRVFARALAHGLLAAESVTTPRGRFAAHRELFPRTHAAHRAAS
ncbi:MULTISPECIES: P1 family peptidase [Actinosynnema]|uniref:P1 family peptidase n=1 Tax=Actinosynnema TaxID=40566 RepID=UPI0020A33B1B|nr:P1 family peptidase [Actinosynnema pretiosum]MCP2097018.1 putative pantetheine hydrolase [Actinosynnema pretiosum]